MQLVFFMDDRKFSQTKPFSQKVFMFCLEHFSPKCIIKTIELKVNDPLKECKKYPWAILNIRGRGGQLMMNP